MLKENNHMFHSKLIYLLLTFDIIYVYWTCLGQS